jgi:hypothetical protein
LKQVTSMKHIEIFFNQPWCKRPRHRLGLSLFQV